MEGTTSTNDGDRSSVLPGEPVVVKKDEGSYDDGKAPSEGASKTANSDKITKPAPKAPSSASDYAAKGGDRGRIGDMASGIKDSLKDSLSIDIRGMKAAGKSCHQAALETSQISNTTTSKARQLIDFGIEMKTTLEVFNDGIDASDFTAVARVVGSDRMRVAMGIASEMDGLSLACVNQSVKMIDSIDAGIETLPDVLEKQVDKRMDRAKEKGSKEGDPELPNLEPDVRELEETVKSVQDANPMTAMLSLERAFTSISSKTEKCKSLFEVIQDFARDVAGVSEAIENFQLGKMAGHVKDLVRDIWRCLRLSDLIRSFAVAAGKLIKWIIKVMKAVMNKASNFLLDIGNMGCCVAFENNILKKCGIDWTDLQKFGQELLRALAKSNPTSTSGTGTSSNTGGTATGISTGNAGVVT